MKANKIFCIKSGFEGISSLFYQLTAVLGCTHLLRIMTYRSGGGTNKMEQKDYIISMTNF